jgi:hypothetical protein
VNHESVSPKLRSIPLGPFQIFQKFAEIFACQGAPPVSTKTGDKFATGINDTSGKFYHQFCLCYWYQWQICPQCQWQMTPVANNGTISCCWDLKVNLKAKMYLYINSTSQRCPNKIIKTFMTEGFFHSLQVSMTPVVHLELRISRQIFEKIINCPYGILRGLGETDSWKKSEVENFVTLSL